MAGAPRCCSCSSKKSEFGPDRNTMRYSTLLLSTLMLLAVSACQTAQNAIYRAPGAESISVEIPLPYGTPSRRLTTLVMVGLSIWRVIRRAIETAFRVP
jgi:hypothetical protein